MDFEASSDFRNVIETLYDYAEEFKMIYEEKLKEDNRKASGSLIRSIRTEVKIGNLVYSVEFNAMPYYKYIEEGTRPHMPPREAILKWIQTKPILPRPMKNGKLPTSQQLAFLISRAIKQKGTIKDKNYDGGHYIKETVDELNARYLPLLKEALESDFDAYSIKIFNRVNKTIKI